MQNIQEEMVIQDNNEKVVKQRDTTVAKSVIESTATKNVMDIQDNDEKVVKKQDINTVDLATVGQQERLDKYSQHESETVVTCSKKVQDLHYPPQQVQGEEQAGNNIRLFKVHEAPPESQYRHNPLQPMNDHPTESTDHASASQDKASEF